MKIKELSEVVWKYYNDGRPKATGQTISKNDVQEMVQLGFSNLLRQRYYESKKLNEYGQADFSAVSAIVGTIEFTLSEPNTVGMRRADMKNFDLYRLPDDFHVSNMYPVGGSCGSEEIGKISLVRLGEERFYIGSEFDFFLFAVVKGRGIDFYNLPMCVKSVVIETTYNNDDLDISGDIAFEIANNILGTVLRLPQFDNKTIDNSYSPPQIELRRSTQQGR